MYNVTFFSWRCPSRGAVNIPHHCLFKEDGVRVRSNGKSNPKSRVFSVWLHACTAGEAL